MKTIFGQYKEFQFGKLIVFVMVAVQIFMLYAYVNKLGNNPLTGDSFMIEILVFTLVILLFYGMTTKVDGREIVVSFGVGLIKKRFDMLRVRQVEVVKNPWYYGWGIRFIPHGMLYNVSGSGGVELKFNDSDRVVRIGTENPAQLKEEILKRIKSEQRFEE